MQDPSNPRLQAGFKAPRFQRYRITASRVLQGSKVAMSKGKVPSLHHDPKDARFQGFKLDLKTEGFQDSGVSGFQGLSLQVFQSSMLRICRHMKQSRTLSEKNAK